MRYTGTLLNKTKTCITIEAYFHRENTLVHDLYLNRGDRFIEKYFTDKWFNILEIHDKDDDKIKCWYCNISTPPIITSSTISYQDLALDLLVYPDGKQIILDDDEFHELVLPTNIRQNATLAMCHLQTKFHELFKNKIYPDSILNKFT